MPKGRQYYKTSSQEIWTWLQERMQMKEILLYLQAKLEQNLIHTSTVCNTQSSACKLETAFSLICMNLPPNKKR